MPLAESGGGVRLFAVEETLAEKTGLSAVTLETIGRSLYEDAVVGYLWHLWQEGEEPAPAPAAAS